MRERQGKVFQRPHPRGEEEERREGIFKVFIYEVRLGKCKGQGNIVSQWGK